MTELAEVYPTLRAAGVELHAITAEAGGTEAVLGRLANRKVGALPFRVHADPEQRLLASSGEDFYMKEEMDAGAEFGPDYEGVRYEMVQPAFLVLDEGGNVMQRWSWRSLEPPPEPMLWSTRVKLGSGEEGLLVRARPKASDILPSIQEGRSPTLAICSWLEA